MILEIKSIQDVKSFACHLIEKDKVSFHPDDDFESYKYQEKGNVKTFYTKREAILRNKLMNDCFRICDKFNIEIYEFMFQIITERSINQYGHS